MSSAFIGRFVVVSAGDGWAVIDRFDRVPATFADGSPAWFVSAKDAMLWAFMRVARRVGA